MKGNMLEGSYTMNSSLFIQIKNLNEFNQLMEEVKEKEKALHEAVLKLENFNLEISFIDTRNKSSDEPTPPFYGKCSACNADIIKESDQYCWHCGKKLEPKEFFRTINSYR